MLEFPQVEDRKLFILNRFLSEVNDMLDSSNPLPRRAALAYKWCWLLHGLGFTCKIEDVSQLDSDTIYNLAKEMLKWVANLVREE